MKRRGQWWRAVGLWLRPWRIVPLLLALYCAVAFLLPIYRLRNDELSRVWSTKTSKESRPVTPEEEAKTKTTTTTTTTSSSDSSDSSADSQPQNNTLYTPATQDLVHQVWDFNTDPCSRFPDLQGIQLVMKTGASEAYEKLPSQILASLQCLPDNNLLLFSDLEQQMGRYHLHDALAGVSASVRQNNKEFALYEAQKRCAVSLKDCVSGMEGAWHLDKYKFVNMALRTWAMRPNQRWYVFAEADSYVFWDNLVAWLKTRDPDKDTYVGNVALYDGFPFAHGGSGYVISGRLLQRLSETNGEDGSLAARFDAAAPDTCCGDVLLGMALAEVGARVSHAYPMFTGDPPASLPFGPGLWCEPVLTLHHMSPQEVGLAWQFEQTRLRPEKPILLRDVYLQFVAPHLVRRRNGWDNLSADVCYIAPDAESQRRAGAELRAVQRNQEDKSPVERAAHRGPDACEAVCEAAGLDVDAASWASAADVVAMERRGEGGGGDDDDNEDHDDESDDSSSSSTASSSSSPALQQDAGSRRRAWLSHRYEARASKSDKLKFHRRRDCFQWRYHAGVCCTGSGVKLGRPRKHPYRGMPWISGWFVRGINDWADSQGVCEPLWREPVQ
ncbi:hypothetical protein CP533_0480 [Ophiocordyceps camponoti-saundersi (nom. inval.)]|nr:hypothetical protein CP533_0480 [Ophiocordyceps camponoti-saundersi (nom. inval.)]